MTIEARATLPAGWYTDPGKSGGKRWWDGLKWTEHLQLPVKATAPTATVRTAANPYGLNGISAAPREAATGENPIADAEVSKPARNNAAWLALLCGVGALGFTVFDSLPGSRMIWVSAAGGVALLLGFRALALHRSGSATIAWAPILGMLLGLAATISIFTGVGVVSIVNSFGPQAAPTATRTAIVARSTSTVPIAFPGNPQLSADETAVQSLATALNRTYAAGNSSLSAAQTWPEALTMRGSVVVAPSGVDLVTLPEGLTANYQLSHDKASYQITVTKPGTSELATYNSSTNNFSWSCLAADTRCVPAH